MTLSGSKVKWLIGAAIVSLCLNLFLVGLMAGGRMHGWGPHGPDGPGGGFMGGMMRGFGPGMMPGLDGVPPEVRDLVKQKFEAQKPKFEAGRDAVKAAREKLASAASADPYDPAAFDAAFQEMQQAMLDMAATAHATIGEILPQVPAETRRDWVAHWGRKPR
jgi:hypothetical protein